MSRANIRRSRKDRKVADVQKVGTLSPIDEIIELPGGMRSFEQAAEGTCCSKSLEGLNFSDTVVIIYGGPQDRKTANAVSDLVVGGEELFAKTYDGAVESDGIVMGPNATALLSVSTATPTITDPVILIAPDVDEVHIKTASNSIAFTATDDMHFNVSASHGHGIYLEATEDITADTVANAGFAMRKVAGGFFPATSKTTLAPAIKATYSDADTAAEYPESTSAYTNGVNVWTVAAAPVAGDTGKFKYVAAADNATVYASLYANSDAVIQCLDFGAVAHAVNQLTIKFETSTTDATAVRDNLVIKLPGAIALSKRYMYFYGSKADNTWIPLVYKPSANMPFPFTYSRASTLSFGITGEFFRSGMGLLSMPTNVNVTKTSGSAAITYGTTTASPSIEINDTMRFKITNFLYSTSEVAAGDESLRNTSAWRALELAVKIKQMFKEVEVIAVVPYIVDDDIVDMGIKCFLPTSLGYQSAKAHALSLGRKNVLSYMDVTMRGCTPLFATMPNFTVIVSKYSGTSAAYKSNLPKIELRVFDIIDTVATKNLVDGYYKLPGMYSTLVVGEIKSSLSGASDTLLTTVKAKTTSIKTIVEALISSVTASKLDDVTKNKFVSTSGTVAKALEKLVIDQTNPELWAALSDIVGISDSVGAWGSAKWKYDVAALKTAMSTVATHATTLNGLADTATMSDVRTNAAWTNLVEAANTASLRATTIASILAELNVVSGDTFDAVAAINAATTGLTALFDTVKTAVLAASGTGEWSDITSWAPFFTKVTSTKTAVDLASATNKTALDALFHDWSVFVGDSTYTIMLTDLQAGSMNATRHKNIGFNDSTRPDGLYTLSVTIGQSGVVWTLPLSVTTRSGSLHSTNMVVLDGALKSSVTVSSAQEIMIDPAALHTVSGSLKIDGTISQKSGAALSKSHTDNVELDDLHVASTINVYPAGYVSPKSFDTQTSFTTDSGELPDAIANWTILVDVSNVKLKSCHYPAMYNFLPVKYSETAPAGLMCRMIEETNSTGGREGTGHAEFSLKTVAGAIYIVTDGGSQLNGKQLSTKLASSSDFMVVAGAIFGLNIYQFMAELHDAAAILPGPPTVTLHCHWHPNAYASYIGRELFAAKETITLVVHEECAAAAKNFINSVISTHWNDSTIRHKIGK